MYDIGEPIYLNEETCKTRLGNNYLAGKRRYTLSLISLFHNLSIEWLDKYSKFSCDTIEEAISKMSDLVGELLADRPELMFHNKGTNAERLRKCDIGISDAATGGYAHYNLGTLIDAYVISKVVNQMPNVKGFALGVEVDGKQ